MRLLVSTISILRGRTATIDRGRGAVTVLFSPGRGATNFDGRSMQRIDIACHRAVCSPLMSDVEEAGRDRHLFLFNRRPGHRQAENAVTYLAEFQVRSFQRRERCLQLQAGEKFIERRQSMALNGDNDLSSLHR